MLEHEYETMRQVEDAYWWYRLLREFTTQEVAFRIAGKNEVRLLDAGCGTGGTMEALRLLPEKPLLNGIDISPLAVEFTRTRGFEHVQIGSIDQLPHDDESMDGVISLDVLYHEGLDEGRALQEFFRVLKPGGFLILNLPAFKFLRGSHDVAVGGVRRYHSRQLNAMIAKQGFETSHTQYWNAWLFAPVFFWRQLSRCWVKKTDTSAKSDLKPMPNWLGEMLTRIGRMDFRACRQMHIPFGTSVFSVALKPSPP